MTEFKPRIINEELYARWLEVYDRLHSDAEFCSCVKRNPANPDHFIVLGYNSKKEEYYDNWPTEDNCSFDDNIDERKIYSKSFGKYSLLINNFSPVRGLVLLHYKDHIHMNKSDPEEDLETWLEIAEEKHLRIFVNSVWGASQPWHQHGQGYLFEVPFEYFLKNNMDGFPGKSYIFKSNDVKGAAGLIKEMRRENKERTTFVIEDVIGVIPRFRSDEAVKYFGVPPSGGPLLGIIGSRSIGKHNMMIKDGFADIWANLQKTFVRK